MNKESTLKKEYLSEKEWHEKNFSISHSHNTKDRGIIALKVFDTWCKEKLEIPDPDVTDLELEYRKKAQGLNGLAKRTVLDELESKIKERYAKIYADARIQLIKQLTAWYEQDKQDIQSICTSLEKFVTFCSEDHPEVRATRYSSFKAKKGSTIRGYFSSVKAYLRKCHGIRLSTDDVKDFISFPKDLKQAREPIEMESLKQVLAYSTPKRKALYYVLLSSGMRLAEGLYLTRASFDTSVRPIEVHLKAQETKAREARDTYISEEAWERVKPIFDKTEEGKYLFHDYVGDRAIMKAVRDQGRYFDRLRKKIADISGDKERCPEFPEGTGILKRYEDSNRYYVQIHAFRAWFSTKAKLRHGEMYGHALTGHGSYLKQYDRIPKKERPKMYLELEKDLLLESSRIASEQYHEKEVADMKEMLMEQQAKIEKLMREKTQRVSFDGSKFGVVS
jgi:integrase